MTAQRKHEVDFEEFETEARMIPELKSTLLDSDYSLKKWTVSEDEHGRTLAFTATRTPQMTLPLNGEDGASKEEEE